MTTYLLQLGTKGLFTQQLWGEFSGWGQEALGDSCAGAGHIPLTGQYRLLQVLPMLLPGALQEVTNFVLHVSGCSPNRGLDYTFFPGQQKLKWGSCS